MIKILETSYFIIGFEVNAKRGLFIFLGWHVLVIGSSDQPAIEKKQKGQR